MPLMSMTGLARAIRLYLTDYVRQQVWLEHILLTICDKFDFFLNDKKRKIDYNVMCYDLLGFQICHF